jgi:hypothetical protein
MACRRRHAASREAEAAKKESFEADESNTE